MVIVVGASGFIGTYLVDALIKSGYDVLATGRSAYAQDYYRSIGVKYISFDIAKAEDIEKLPKEGVEAVILLAAMLPANETKDDHLAYVDANIKSTLNLLLYCKKYGVNKFISTTSYADLQGKWNGDYPLPSDESRSYKLNDDHASYIITKNAATDFIIEFNELYNMQCSIFRLPPVYGVGPHGTIYVDGKVYKSGFQIFVEKSLASEPITVSGDPNTVRDVVYVKDVANAFILAIKSDKAKGIYNISSGYKQTLLEQVKDIVKVFSPKDKQSEIIIAPGKPGKSFWLDITKATNDFGYTPIYAPFTKLLEDYKEELKIDRFKHLTQSRNKN